MVIKDFGMPFNDVASDRLYSAADWQEYYKKLVDNGVVGDVVTSLKIEQQTVSNKTVKVNPGAIVIEGAMRVIDSALNATISDNTSGNPRVDRIIARLNTADRMIEFAVKQGTPASSPTAPALTQNSTTYEISLAQVSVANGFSTIVTANITDERIYMTYKDRILNDRMTVLEGDVDDVNTRMDGMDPAKYYGKYSQLSNGSAHSGSAGKGIITFGIKDNDDFSAINLATFPKRITVPTGVTRVRLYWKGTLNNNGIFGVNIYLNKNGQVRQTMVGLFGGSTTSTYLTTMAMSEIVNCVSGDYFEINADTAGVADPSAVLSGSIFGMEVLK